MTAGKRLEVVTDYKLAFDDEGNLLLDTKGRFAGQIQSGNIPQFGGAGIPTNVAISNVAGGTQYYCALTFQVTDLAGVAVSGVFDLDVLLSDAASGAGIAAHTPSGGSTFTTGATLQIYTAGKAFRVQTDATGKAVMQIIDSSTTAYYPASNFANRQTVGAQLTTGSYHA